MTPIAVYVYRAIVAVLSATLSGMAAYQISRHGPAVQIGLDVAGAVWFGLFMMIIPQAQETKA